MPRRSSEAFDGSVPIVPISGAASSAKRPRRNWSCFSNWLPINLCLRFDSLTSALSIFHTFGAILVLRHIHPIGGRPGLDSRTAGAQQHSLSLSVDGASMAPPTEERARRTARQTDRRTDSTIGGAGPVRTAAHSVQGLTANWSKEGKVEKWTGRRRFRRTRNCECRGAEGTDGPDCAAHFVRPPTEHRRGCPMG